MDKAEEEIFIRHFFEDCVSFFIQSQPSTEDAYMWGYGMAHNVWIPFGQNIDTYPLPQHLKDDLKKLFSLADDFFLHVMTTDTYRSTVSYQKWEELRVLANKVYQSGRQAGVFERKLVTLIIPKSS